MFYQSKGLSSCVGVFLIVIIDIGIYSTVVLKFCVFSPRYCCFHVYITCLHVYMLTCLQNCSYFVLITCQFAKSNYLNV